MKNKLFIFAALAALLLASCKDNAEPENPSVPVSDIAITTPLNSLSLVNGTTYQIAAEVLPKNANNKKISYSSNNRNIANVDEKGLISTHQVGMTTITLKAENISKTINVTVTAARVNVTGIAVASTDENVSIVKDSTHQLSAAVKPENATNKTLTYSSDHDDIASVDRNGLISAKTVGTASVTIHAADSITKTISVTVTAARVNVTGIAVASADENVSIVKDGTHQLSASVKPENATDKTLTYSSDREDIASVDTNGLISAKNVGTASVTIHAENNITKTISVTVTEAEIPVTAIEFDPPLPTEPLELTIGDNYELKLKVMPDNATNKALSVVSSNDDIAWPNEEGNRWIKAKHAGSATITIISVGTPTVKRDVQFVIKNPPEIKYDSKTAVMAESSAGNVSFDLQTLNGKLEYTPEVVGGGIGEKIWLTFVRKDTSNANKDTLTLSCTENKTVWERTAYIKFKGTDNKYIKGSDNNDLEVKLNQKENNNPTVTIKWVDGIGEPEENERKAIPVCQARKEDGELTTEKQFYWDDSEIFWWNESNTTKWFNNRKAKPVGAVAPDGGDGNQCWAKTSSNMLHWWFVQNKENIDNYITKKNITGTRKDEYQDFYTRGIPDNQEPEKSYIAKTFRVKAHNGNKGDYIIGGLSWYLYGNKTGKISRQGKDGKPLFDDPALFKDVFSKENTPIERINVYGKDNFNEIISSALKSKKAIGIDIWGTKGGNEYGHAITLWGAVFDEEGNILAIYVVDNNFQENRIFPYGIWYKEGKPYLFNYGVNNFVKDRYVGQVTTLDKGEEQWQKWRDANP